jgi:hypothetical protein
MQNNLCPAQETHVEEMEDDSEYPRARRNRTTAGNLTNLSPSMPVA